MGTWISVPTVAKERYFAYCDQHNAMPLGMERDRVQLLAYAYMDAVEDLCGSRVKMSIMMDADLRLDLPDVPGNEMMLGMLNTRVWVNSVNDNGGKPV